MTDSKFITGGETENVIYNNNTCNVQTQLCLYLCLNIASVVVVSLKLGPMKFNLKNCKALEFSRQFPLVLTVKMGWRQVKALVSEEGKVMGS
jgi:hypothetical protein